MEEVPPETGDPEGPQFFDNLSRGIWSPRKMEPLTPLDRWSGTILRMVLTWSLFLFMGMGLSVIFRIWGVSDAVLATVSFSVLMGVGFLILISIYIGEKRFQRKFGMDQGIWYFSSVRSQPIEVDDILDSAEDHLKAMGLRITSEQKGTIYRRTRYIRIEETPLMVVLSYDLGKDGFAMEVEVGPQRRSFRNEMIGLMAAMRDWSGEVLRHDIGELGPDPKDPGVLRI